VPGGSWAPNPDIKLQLHPLQDALRGFGKAHSAYSSSFDEFGVLWRCGLRCPAS
jgi:hypothetical protein